MTHHPIKELPDGTRVYSNGTKYRPTSPDKRRNSRRQPDHPDAVRFYDRWFVPLELLADHKRVMPETRPDPGFRR